MSQNQENCANHVTEQAPAVEQTSARRVFAPRVDILETEDAIVVLADMPGVDESGVDITMERNVLTLKGTVNCSKPEGFKSAHSEYGVGDYERVFTLPNEIDRDNVQATIKQGVLRLTLPKSKSSLQKKVAVLAG